MSDTAAPAYPGYGGKAYRAYVLAALLVIYTFNFIDRILISIVQEPIRREFNLEYGVLGWLGGPAFAVLYTLLGIPIARWAERGNRVSIVALGAAVWSAMTALCGFAGSFTQLVLARIGVGIGEAACTPPSHSIISDYFPAERRATALAIYALGVPIGTMLAAVGGGWLVQNLGWREAFWALGAPGLIAALALKLSVREPPRMQAGDAAPTFGETLKVLAGKSSFWQMAFAAALVSFVGYSTAQFLVSYIHQVFGLDIVQASLAFGLIAGLSAGLGTFLGGALCDRLGARHPRIMSWLPALGIALALALYLVAFQQSDFRVAFAILLVAPVFHYMYLSPTFAVAQSVVPPRMRATAAAVLILVINLIGYGLGPPFLGTVAEYFTAQNLAAGGMSLAACHGVETGLCATARADGLKLGMLITVCVLAWPVLHFLLASRTLAKDRVS